MLTGHPPFQSSTSDEIYRRVKSVEYDWPGAKACANDIPDQAKDLVAWLLQADAEERPDTDEVVGHPFFSMHGGNAIPLILENTCRTAKPAWLKSESPRGDVMRKDCEFLPLKTLARQCGVGKLAGNEKPFEVIGGNVDLSMYKECLLEEEDESYPIVPLPKDMVYTGKVLSRDRRNIENSKLSSGAQARLETKDWKKMEALALEDDELQGKGPVMRPHVPPRSHAATLRMAHLDTMPSQAGGKAGQNRPTLRGEAASADVGAPSSRNLRPRRGLLMEFPLRSTSNPVSTSLETGTSAKPIPRVTRSKSATVSTTRPTPVVEPPIGIDKQDVPKSQNEDQKDVHRSNLQKGRIAINVQNEMAQTGNIEKQPARSIRSLRSRQIIGNPDRERLIGPDEVAECVPGTKPNEVLSNLEKIYKELDSSLRSLNSEIDHTDIAMDIPSKKATSTHPVIVKWVDYTNKFGVGYILANGTVGCIFNGDSRVPYSCVVVAGAERHVSKRKLASYVDKEQIVQRYGAPAEFLEDCGGNGIKRVFVPASKLQVKGGPSGIANSFEHEATGCDFEKHKRLSIWGKFGKYMTQNIDLNLMDEESGGTARNRTRRPAAGPFVKFYQRLGNVGIWGYDDGSFQLNFPDHTKFIMSDGGSWLDYYYLPIETANALKQHGHLGKDELADRSMLSYPTAMMVRGISPEQDFRHLIAANAVISKLEFVRKVVGIWLACGGLGCLGSEKYLKWEGTREGSGNLIWASVGAHGGDRRYQVKQDV